jgi:transposase
MQNIIVAGIDVSKSKADLCILPDGIVATFSLDDDGIAALIENLRTSAVNLAVMEATGYSTPHISDQCIR